MADEGNSGEKPSEQQRYSREDLVERRRTLLPDVESPYAILGALAGDDRETFTVKQAEDAIKRFGRLTTEPDAGAPDAEEATA